MKKLRIGIIGSGGRGNVFRFAHKPDENVKITACCDLSEDVLKKNKEVYGDDIFTTNDYRKLLEQDIDAVAIATPDYLHEEHAVASLEKKDCRFFGKTYVYIN